MTALGAVSSGPKKCFQDILGKRGVKQIQAMAG